MLIKARIMYYNGTNMKLQNTKGYKKRKEAYGISIERKHK